MFSKIHTVPQKMCAIDRDNFQSVEEKEEKKTGERKKKKKTATYPPARYNYSTNYYYYYILPELEPIPLHIHFLTIP